MAESNCYVCFESVNLNYQPCQCKVGVHSVCLNRYRLTNSEVYRECMICQSQYQLTPGIPPRMLIFVLRLMLGLVISLLSYVYFKFDMLLICISLNIITILLIIHIVDNVNDLNQLKQFILSTVNTIGWGFISYSCISLLVVKTPDSLFKIMGILSVLNFTMSPVIFCVCLAIEIIAWHNFRVLQIHASLLLMEQPTSLNLAYSFNRFRYCLAVTWSILKSLLFGE